MTQTQVLFIGDRDWPEFVGPVQWLIERAEVSFSTDMASACAVLMDEQLHAAPLTSAGRRGDSVPATFDVIVVAQRRANEHPFETFDRLRERAPLTPILFLLGSLCEGEARTGKPWPGAVRIYAHQFVARVGAELTRLATNGTTTWAPPFTATDEDRLLASPPAAGLRLTARVAVISRDRQTASAICDTLQFAGCTSMSCRDDLAGFDENVDLIVWDCSASFASCQTAFEGLVRRLPRIPKVVLAGFLRADDIAAARAQGAHALISKPFMVEDLLWQIRECLIASRQTPRGEAATKVD